MTGISELTHFPSLAALKDAHNELLQRRRSEGESPALLDAVEAFIGRAQATGVLLDRDDARDTAQSLLTYWDNLLYRAGRVPPDSTLAEFDPLLAPELPDELCPYLGLDAFRESDGKKFFGRAELIARLVERLADQRLLAIVGPSGSGKSSLVRAGLIPALKSGALPGSRDWRYLPPIVPGSDPLVSLERALRTENQEPRTDVSNAVLGSPVLGSPMLLVVDQFEELFSLCDSEESRQRFIARLLELSTTAEAQHRIILTMRSDFEAFVARAPTLQALFEAGRVQATPLSAAELREAIEQPAEAVGLKFQAGIVDALLQDILGEPAGLPLLQFTLLKLWEQRDHNRVTREIYERVGGGRLALARSADAVYNSLIPEDQVAARRILLRMVRPGEGLEITSSRVRRADLYRGSEDPGRIDRVLAKLIGARLVRLTEGKTPEDTQVEVAHEALVRNWPTLVDWLDEERVALATRRRLEERAAEWVRLGQSAGGLLDEVELREAERWLASPEAAYLGYDPALPELVATSRAAIAAVVQKQKSAYQRLRLLTFALIGALIAALVATAVAFGQRNDAHQEAIARTTAEADAKNHAGTAEAERLAAQAALDLLLAHSSTPAPTGVPLQPTSEPAPTAPPSTPNTIVNPGPPARLIFVGEIVEQPTDTTAPCGDSRASSIYGRVEDADGNGIGGATVRVSDQGQRHSFDVRTNPAGTFLVTTLGCTTWFVDLIDVPNAPKSFQANQLVIKGLDGKQLSAAEIRFQQQ